MFDIWTKTVDASSAGITQWRALRPPSLPSFFLPISFFRVVKGRLTMTNRACARASSLVLCVMGGVAPLAWMQLSPRPSKEEARWCVQVTQKGARWLPVAFTWDEPKRLKNNASVTWLCHWNQPAVIRQCLAWTCLEGKMFTSLPAAGTPNRAELFLQLLVIWALVVAVSNSNGFWVELLRHSLSL